jgi:death-on-curing protein
VKEPRWFRRAECLALHDMMLAQYGGRSGLRDENMLENALAKPVHLFVYGRPNLAEIAASYAAGIVKNRPFVDGNKRTGFMLAAGFLERNGMTFTAGEADAVLQTLALAAGDLDEARYAAWLKANSRRRRAR